MPHDPVLPFFDEPIRPLPQRFDGSDYTPALDQQRLSKQFDDIFALMRDGQWRTLGEIEAVTQYPQASISAQLRHMRKPRFGGHTLEKRRRGMSGTFEYSLVVNP